MAAAANYTTVLSSDRILDTASAGRRSTPWPPPRPGPAPEELRPGGGLLRQGLGVGEADSGAQVLRATPVGWRVVDYSDRAATSPSG